MHRKQIPPQFSSHLKYAYILYCKKLKRKKKKKHFISFFSKAQILTSEICVLVEPCVTSQNLESAWMPPLLCAASW